jgi:hypothetical protein
MLLKTCAEKKTRGLARIIIKEAEIELTVVASR